MYTQLGDCISTCDQTPGLNNGRADLLWLVASEIRILESQIVSYIGSGHVVPRSINTPNLYSRGRLIQDRRHKKGKGSRGNL